MFELFHLFYSLSFISLSSLEGSLLFILYSISFYWYIYVCVYFFLVFKKYTTFNPTTIFLLYC